MHQINREISPSEISASQTVAISPPVVVPTDGELLLRFTRGEQEAFAQLVDRHRRVVWLACWQVLRHRQDVEDTFQATFLILARKASSLHAVDSLAAWLHRVAYRAAIRLLRNKKRHATAQSPLEVEMSEDKLLQIQRREESSILLEELRSLPDKYQVPLILCYFEGRTRSAAAEEMGCTTATVKGRLARGKSMLRIRMTRRGVGFSVAMAALSAPLKQAEASLSGPLIAEVVASCQSLQLGQPFPDGLSNQVLSLSQQSFLQEGILAMTTASLAKPICIGVALLGLATAAVADAVQEAKGPESTATSPIAGFELAAPTDEQAEVVEVEIAATPEATTLSRPTKPEPPAAVEVPATPELPELPELVPVEPKIIVSELTLKSDPYEPASILLREAQRTKASATVAATRAMSAAQEIAKQAKAVQISALKDTKRSLEMKSEGLKLQANAKGVRADALEADDEQVREKLLRKADAYELRAESILLEAEALMTDAKVVEIDRQIESLSKKKQMIPAAPQTPRRPGEVIKAVVPAASLSGPLKSLSRPDELVEVEVQVAEQAAELKMQEAKLRELMKLVDQQHKQQARAAKLRNEQQARTAQLREQELAKQMEALRQAEQKLHQQLDELMRKRQQIEQEQQSKARPRR